MGGQHGWSGLDREEWLLECLLACLPCLSRLVELVLILLVLWIDKEGVASGVLPLGLSPWDLHLLIVDGLDRIIGRVLLDHLAAILVDHRQ